MNITEFNQRASAEGWRVLHVEYDMKDRLVVALVATHSGLLLFNSRGITYGGADWDYLDIIKSEVSKR